MIIGTLLLMVGISLIFGIVALAYKYSEENIQNWENNNEDEEP